MIKSSSLRSTQVTCSGGIVLTRCILKLVNAASVSYKTSADYGTRRPKVGPQSPLVGHMICPDTQNCIYSPECLMMEIKFCL